MAPTIGRVALDNGFHGSIPGDWVAPPPQNIQESFVSEFIFDFYDVIEDKRIETEEQEIPV